MMGGEGIKPLSHFTGLAKWMETKQSLLKSVNLGFLYVLNLVYLCRVHSMSADIRQMLCSISRPNNNEQEYCLSGSVHYIKPVRCDGGFRHP